MTTDAATEAHKLVGNFERATLPAKKHSDATPPNAKLFAAMAKARGEMRQPKLDGTNPHFKSKYVTLSGLLEAIMPALAANGLHIWQVPDGDDLLTIVSHESGESMEFRVALPNGGTIQQLGSVLTYLKRYTLASIVGVAGDLDDDGNEAMNSTPAVITMQQSLKLHSLVKESGADLAGFLKFCKVDSFDNMLASKYRAAVKALEKKREEADASS